MKLLRLFCLISILAVFTGTIQASEEIYKWVDEGWCPRIILRDHRKVLNISA